MTDFDFYECFIQLTGPATCGFRKTVELPAKHLFNRSKVVKILELDVRTIRHGILFDRKTEWSRHPIVFHPQRGILFVYKEETQGFALRISTARSITFDARKSSRLSSPKGVEGVPDSMVTYESTISLIFSYGELQLRVPEEAAGDWRFALISAHNTGRSNTLMRDTISEAGGIGFKRDWSKATTLRASFKKRCDSVQEDFAKLEEMKIRRESAPSE